MRNQPIQFGDTYRLNLYSLNRPPVESADDQVVDKIVNEISALEKIKGQVENAGFEAELELVDKSWFLFTNGPTEDTLSRYKEIAAETSTAKLPGQDEDPPRKPTQEEIEQFSDQVLVDWDALEARLIAEGLVSEETPTLDLPYVENAPSLDNDRISFTAAAMHRLDEAFKKAD